MVLCAHRPLRGCGAARGEPWIRRRHDSRGVWSARRRVLRRGWHSAAVGQASLAMERSDLDTCRRPLPVRPTRHNGTFDGHACFETTTDADAERIVSFWHDAGASMRPLDSVEHVRRLSRHPTAWLLLAEAGNRDGRDADRHLRRLAWQHVSAGRASRTAPRRHRAGSSSRGRAVLCRIRRPPHHRADRSRPALGDRVLDRHRLPARHRTSCGMLGSRFTWTDLRRAAKRSLK